MNRDLAGPGIDRGKDAANENAVIFETLATQRASIDAAFGSGAGLGSHGREPQDHLNAERWRLHRRRPLARDPAGDDLGDGAAGAVE
jgi:hypothetical protein